MSLSAFSSELEFKQTINVIDITDDNAYDESIKSAERFLNVYAV